jgi:hypothetical protein
MSEKNASMHDGVLVISLAIITFIVGLLAKALAS